MKPINFYKMSGSGNDFVIVDNRRPVVDENDLPAFIAKVCRRKMSVGADGFILIEDADTVDFRWRFFNSDGSTAEMCGNGARCAARFAFLNGIAGAEMSFETIAGIVDAKVSGEQASIRMTEPLDLKTDYTVALEKGPLVVSSVNTGVPHVVFQVESIEKAPVVEIGREIRYHKAFAPAGTNVNFIQPIDGGDIAIRTYERGVEDETLACGTGSVAAAVIVAVKTKQASPIRVLTRSGEFLTIYFQQTDSQVREVFLEGDARVIYKGELSKDAWK
jgi:diaminopimelate epimerase